MQQKVNLSSLRALSSRLKQADLSLEQQISKMQRDLKAQLSQVRSEYSESYVNTAVENAEVNLGEVWKSALRIREYLSKQSDHLNWSVEHYLRTENLLKSLHIQTSFRLTKQTQVALITPIKGYQIFASETLLQRLKQLCTRFYTGMLLRKLGEYQQGDPRIFSLIQRMEKGSLTEQKDAREKLSAILHAFQEITHSQTAYNIYKQFGNERNTMAALKNADEQRRLLAKLGVSKEWYASSVDLSKQYPSSSLSVCLMNPLRDGSQMPTDLPEMMPVFILAMINEPYREWASANLDGLEQQALLFRESLTENPEEQQATIGPLDPYNSVSLEDILNRNDPEVFARLKNTYWSTLSPEEQDRRYAEIKKEAEEYDKKWRDKERSARTGIGNSFMAKVFDGGTNMVVQAINTASVGIAGQVAELVMGPESEGTYDPLDHPNGKKAGEIIGNIIGFALPFKLLKAVKTPKALEKLSPTLVRSMMAEGVFSTATEVSDALNDFKNDGTQSLKERIGKVAINTTAAGVGDVVIRFAAKAVFKSYQGIRQQLQELAVTKSSQGTSGKIGTIQAKEGKFISDEVAPKKGKEVVGEGRVEGTSDLYPTRAIDPIKEANIIIKVKELRSLLTSDYKKSGNFALAEVRIANIKETEFFAHSSIDELSPSLSERVPNISIKPTNPVFKATNAPNKEGVWYPRDSDTEYKILNQIASELKEKTDTVGTIKLFTELDTCLSCNRVIDEFTAKYKNITVEVIHNNGKRIK